MYSSRVRARLPGTTASFENFQISPLVRKTSLYRPHGWLTSTLLRQYVAPLLHDRSQGQPVAIPYIPDVLQLFGTGIAGVRILPFVRIQPVINSRLNWMGKKWFNFAFTMRILKWNVAVIKVGTRLFTAWIYWRRNFMGRNLPCDEKNNHGNNHICCNHIKPNVER